MSKTAQAELKMQKERRVAHCQKNITELAELEVKHAKAHAQMLRQAIQAIKAESWKLKLQCDHDLIFDGIWCIYKVSAICNEML